MFVHGTELNQFSCMLTGDRGAPAQALHRHGAMTAAPGLLDAPLDPELLRGVPLKVGVSPYGETHRN